uniref:Uncharacterized protein n=1 Tax=Cucumis sativus TaxID=3659 RepID=A0A0A0LDZ9_CUCSA
MRTSTSNPLSAIKDRGRKVNSTPTPQLSGSWCSNQDVRSQASNREMGHQS